MTNLNNQKNCCTPRDASRKTKGVWSGVLYGVLPHTFCNLFIVFTILGMATATAVLKPLLLNAYFFYLLIAFSLIFATISAAIYLRHNKALSIRGIKDRWKYLSTLYGVTIFINLILFMVIFPITANFDPEVPFTTAVLTAFGRGTPSLSEPGFLALRVDIPCPGHALLITREIRTINGVEAVRFKFPNIFDVDYNPEKTSKMQVLSLDVFNTFKATAI